MSARDRLDAIAVQRILILDGAMGSLIQALKLGEADFRGKRFSGHQTPLIGCNDILCLTKPDAISGIHEAYLAAGADIIETCSFNSASVSLADYGLSDLAYEISRAAAALARKAADQFSTEQKPRFVAGSIGPTAKSASLSPDVNDPAKRGIYWDELEAAYYDNARGLLDGGADILLVETVFDTLNAKAALFAISRLLQERNADVPVMISATVSGESGRLLAGQTIEAFCASVLHAAPSPDGAPWAIGLNCSFGAEKLLPHARTLAAAAPCLVSAHPNAGLPNQLGAYDESPATMAACIEQYLKDGLLNIVGGCCGSTPAHIAAIAEKAAQYPPRVPSAKAGTASYLAGHDLLDVAKPRNDFRLTLIGERTNVAGSKKFLRLISEQKYNESLAIARSMVEDGAALICVGMDDAMLDAEKSMCAFLDLALSDPDIAKVPIMIDSSRWNVIEAGLKRLQGKGVVNSINLKDGEKEFLRRAVLVKSYGAAAVIMLIDEQGQAVSYQRKIEIAGRAYKLLTDAGFPQSDIIFDPNVLAVATGISEHDSCAADFIRACSWIRDNCGGDKSGGDDKSGTIKDGGDKGGTKGIAKGGVQISGGISNLSFSFRGNNAVREAMHSVFLKHAADAGLTMAIVNPSTLVAYNAIEENLRNAVEDVILNRRPDAADRLLALAEQTNAAAHSPPPSVSHSLDWRGEKTEARIVHAMVKGLDDFIEADTLELRDSGWRPLAIVEGPLMAGMKEVGTLFGEGKMYLPQVIRSARVMKKAVAALEPYMEKEKSAAAPTIVIATVKGDVHDIGKNIVGVVLASGGYRIVDLGVMVPAEQILEAAEKENAAIIGLSGLISPSLDEMAHVAREMEKRRMNIPLLVGGAAASLAHTALRIAPEYSGAVVYVPDAGKSAEIVRALLSPTDSPRFLQELADAYHAAALRHEAIQSRLEIIPLAEARANKAPLGDYQPTQPTTIGIIELNDYPLDRVIPHIDWNGFLKHWEIKTSGNNEKSPPTDGGAVSSAISGAASGIIADAKALLEKVAAEQMLKLRGVVGIFPATADGDDVIIGGRRFCFLRSQTKKPPGVFNPCVADFVAPRDWVGLFALSAGFGLQEAAGEYKRCGDEYAALLLGSLANALTEAFVEEAHQRVRQEWRASAGIRPAFGYPACPDHQDKRIAFDLLEARERCGLELTESAMIVPAAAACGMFIANPAAYYFGVGAIGEDQQADCAARKKRPAIEHPL